MDAKRGLLMLRCHVHVPGNHGLPTRPYYPMLECIGAVALAAAGTDTAVALPKQSSVEQLFLPDQHLADTNGGGWSYKERSIQRPAQRRNNLTVRKCFDQTFYNDTAANRSALKG